MITFIREHEFTEEQKNLIQEHFTGKEYDTDIILLTQKEYDWGTVFVVQSRVAFSPNMMFALNTFDGSCKRSLPHRLQR